MSDDKVVPIKPKGNEVVTGGIVDSSSASLCFYSEDLDPDKISEILGVEASTYFRKGHRRNANAKPYKKGAWILRIEGDAPSGPNEHLEKLLNNFSLSENIWEQLRNEYESRISVGIHMSGWNRGFALSPKVLALIKNTGIELDFDIYADDE